MPDTDAILGAFDDAGFRLTEPRRTVARLIAGHPGAFTAAELAEASRKARPPVGRATVFRSLEILADLGVVEHIDLPSGEHAYVSCDAAHHHHVVCSACGRSVDAGAGGLSRIIDEVARRSGYRIESHRLELYGLCPACQRSQR